MKNKLLTFVIIFILSSSIFLMRDSVDEGFTQLKKQALFVPPSPHIKKMTLGFDEIVADVLWLRWIQNIDACGKTLVKRESLIAPVVDEKDSFNARITKAQKKLVCDQGWAFRMLDAVTDLSPKFRIPYAVGAANLSVIAEDHIGAKKLYEKALKNYPKDWQILYRGAYHFLFELNDLETAGQWLKKAADNGAPDWLYSLSARVSTRAGKLEFGIKVLEDYIELQANPEYISSLNKRLSSLKQQLQEN